MINSTYVNLRQKIIKCGRIPFSLSLRSYSGGRKAKHHWADKRDIWVEASKKVFLWWTWCAVITVPPSPAFILLLISFYQLPYHLSKYFCFWRKTIVHFWDGMFIFEIPFCIGIHCMFSLRMYGYINEQKDKLWHWKKRTRDIYRVVWYISFQFSQCQLCFLTLLSVPSPWIPVRYCLRVLIYNTCYIDFASEKNHLLPGITANLCH